MRFLFKINCWLFHRQSHRLYWVVRSKEGSFSKYYCDRCNRNWQED